MKIIFPWQGCSKLRKRDACRKQVGFQGNDFQAPHKTFVVICGGRF